MPIEVQDEYEVESPGASRAPSPAPTAPPVDDDDIEDQDDHHDRRQPQAHSRVPRPTWDSRPMFRHVNVNVDSDFLRRPDIYNEDSYFQRSSPPHAATGRRPLSSSYDTEYRPRPRPRPASSQSNDYDRPFSSFRTPMDQPAFDSQRRHPIYSHTRSQTYDSHFLSMATERPNVSRYRERRMDRAEEILAEYESRQREQERRDRNRDRDRESSVEPRRPRRKSRSRRNREERRSKTPHSDGESGMRDQLSDRLNGLNLGSQQHPGARSGQSSRLHSRPSVPSHSQTFGSTGTGSVNFPPPRFGYGDTDTSYTASADTAPPVSAFTSTSTSTNTQQGFSSNHAQQQSYSYQNSAFYTTDTSFGPSGQGSQWSPIPTATASTAATATAYVTAPIGQFSDRPISPDPLDGSMSADELNRPPRRWVSNIPQARVVPVMSGSDTDSDRGGSSKKRNKGKMSRRSDKGKDAVKEKDEKKEKNKKSNESRDHKRDSRTKGGSSRTEEAELKFTRVRGKKGSVKVEASDGRSKAIDNMSDLRRH